MIVYFTETEPESEKFFEDSLADHQIAFCQELGQVGPEAECLSIFIASRVTEEFLAAHPSLKYITTRSTGLDHIDLACCKQRGITVSFVPSYGENTVAEHTFALLLAISRKIRQALTMKRGGAS